MQIFLNYIYNIFYILCSIRQKRNMFTKREYIRSIYIKVSNPVMSVSMWCDTINIDANETNSKVVRYYRICGFVLNAMLVDGKFLLHFDAR